MRETQEVERPGSRLSTLAPIFDREAAEFNQAGLIRMERESEFA
jgi:hypothetical protein